MRRIALLHAPLFYVAPAAAELVSHAVSGYEVSLYRPENGSADFQGWITLLNGSEEVGFVYIRDGEPGTPHLGSTKYVVIDIPIRMLDATLAMLDSGKWVAINYSDDHGRPFAFLNLERRPLGDEQRAFIKKEFGIEEGRRRGVPIWSPCPLTPRHRTVTFPSTRCHRPVIGTSATAHDGDLRHDRPLRRPRPLPQEPAARPRHLPEPGTVEGRALRAALRAGLLRPGLSADLGGPGRRYGGDGARRGPPRRHHRVGRLQRARLPDPLAGRGRRRRPEHRPRRAEPAEPLAAGATCRPMATCCASSSAAPARRPTRSPTTATCGPASTKPRAPTGRSAPGAAAGASPSSSATSTAPACSVCSSPPATAWPACTASIRPRSCRRRRCASSAASSTNTWRRCSRRRCCAGRPR